MTYYVAYWMDDEETALTAEELATRLATARANDREILLVETTATEMHFLEYEKGDI